MGPHFRSTSWGARKEEVLSLEAAEMVSESPDMLRFRSTLVGRDCAVYYGFQHGKLTSGTYMIDAPDDVDDIMAYEDLEGLLTSKYGPPSSSGLEWRHWGKFIKVDTYGQLARAVAAGQVEVRSLWETPDTQIILVCTDQDSEYNVVVWAFYFSVELYSRPDKGPGETDFDMI